MKMPWLLILLLHHHHHHHLHLLFSVCKKHEREEPQESEFRSKGFRQVVAFICICTCTLNRSRFFAAYVPVPRFAKAISRGNKKRVVRREGKKRKKVPPNVFRTDISLKPRKLRRKKSADEATARLKGAGAGADECHFDFLVISVDEVVSFLRDGQISQAS
ncbi:hypothetical protein BT93_D1982 [Corymbia citriodora subsp. variegata]|nr:hypothetical protein BT93_D1982 [Corymbia citriodora subsp. variegata]